MALPAYQIRAPGIVDTLQYALGSKVGIDTATDLWEVDAGSTANGMLSGAQIYGDGSAPRCIVGGFVASARRESVPADQWVAAQCVIPLDDSPGVFPGVRVSPVTRDGYFLENMGYTDATPFTLGLWRMRAGVVTPLASWQLDTAILGLTFWDGFVAMLEVAGDNPVLLRASAMVPKGSDTASMTTLPGDIPEVGGVPCAIVVGTFTDSSASRIVAGRPGLTSTGISGAGALYNFNAGQFLSITAGAVVGGACTVTVYRPSSTTVTLDAPDATVGSITWVGDVGTATVSSLPPGPTTITATASDGETASVQVTGGPVVSLPAEGAVVTFPFPASWTDVPGAAMQIFNDDSGELLASGTADGSGAGSATIGHA